MRVYRVFTDVIYDGNDYVLTYNYSLYKNYETECNYFQRNSLEKIGYFLGAERVVGDIPAHIVIDIDHPGFDKLTEVSAYRDSVIIGLRDDKINMILDENI